MPPTKVNGSEPVLDFEKLLRPISVERPTGADLRSDPASLFLDIRDERNRASRAEKTPPPKEGEQPPPNWRPPDWRPMKEISLQALAEQTKDLDIVAFLLEALVRLDGYAGLRDGFRLARELAERYWDGLYPMPRPEDPPDDTDGEALERWKQQYAQKVVVRRVHMLGQLDGGGYSEGPLIRAIKSVPITEPTSSAVLRCLYYPDALALEKVTDPAVRTRRLNDGVRTLETFRKAVAESSDGFYKALVGDLDQCLAEFDKLCQVLDKRCGSDAPPSLKTRAALQFCKDVVTDLAGGKLAAAPPP